MQYRVGTCQACGATFKVAATFQGDKAKCKSCAGVVHVGPVLGTADDAAKPAPAAPAPARTPAKPARVERAAKAPAKAQARPVAAKKPAAAPKPAAKPAPKPVAKAPEPELVEYKPSGKKGGGPSMKERLLAARGDAPAPAPPVPARKVAPAAAAKPAAKAPAARAAAAKAPAAKASSAKAAAAPAGARAGRAKPAAGGARRSAGARAASSGDEGGARRRGGRSGGGKDKQKSPLPFVAALVGLGAVGFGVWKFVLQKPADTVQAQDTDTAAAPPELTTTDAPETTLPDAPVTDETTDTVEDTGAPAAAPASAPEEKAAPDPEPAAVDDGPDLSLLEPFGPDAGTTEEQWAEIQSDVDLVADTSAGAAGNRARLRLEKVGRPAFPAIVNKMLTLDYSTDEGYRNGDLLQQTLSFIANGKNAGWKYSTSDEDVRFNKKAVALLHKVWNRAKDDEAYWLNYSKQDKKDAKPAEEAAAESALSDDDLDDLDDLDGL